MIIILPTSKKVTSIYFAHFISYLKVSFNEGIWGFRLWMFWFSTLIQLNFRFPHIQENEHHLYGSFILFELKLDNFIFLVTNSKNDLSKTKTIFFNYPIGRYLRTAYVEVPRGTNQHEHKSG